MSKASFVLTGALAIAGWIGVAGTMLVVPATAQAQQKVSQKVGVPLKAAQDSIARKKWDAALGKIKEAYDRNPKLANLLLDDYFRGEIKRAQKGVCPKRRCEMVMPPDFLESYSK